MMKFLPAFVLTAFATPALPAPGDFFCVGPLQAEVKAGPSEDAETEFVIAIGRKLLELGRQGEWVQVGIDKAGGRYGWVHVDVLKSTDPDGLTY